MQNHKPHVTSTRLSMSQASSDVTSTKDVFRFRKDAELCCPLTLQSPDVRLARLSANVTPLSVLLIYSHFACCLGTGQNTIISVAAKGIPVCN